MFSLRKSPVSVRRQNQALEFFGNESIWISLANKLNRFKLRIRLEKSYFVCGYCRSLNTTHHKPSLLLLQYSTSSHWDLEIWAWSVSADARWPALAGYSSTSAVQACCDSPSLSLAPSSKVSHRLLCASLWSCWSPAPAICQMSSTVSSASWPQHLWDPCIFCRQIKSLEFTAWSSVGSSCWSRTI